MRVLIVEDEAVIRTALVALLECQGAGVIAVGSVKEGRDALETLRPDILISNFRLPDGNGAEVLKELRRHDTELGTFTPAIICRAPANILCRHTAHCIENKKRLNK